MKKILDRIIMLKGTQSTAAFGRSVGLNQQTMDRYLKGREPPIGVIKKICEVYGVSADWILGLKEENISETKLQKQQSDCDNCKFKKFAEAFKALQFPE